MFDIVDFLWRMLMQTLQLVTPFAAMVLFYAALATVLKIAKKLVAKLTKKPRARGSEIRRDRSS